jgi:hypothetical protein
LFLRSQLTAYCGGCFCQAWSVPPNLLPHPLSHSITHPTHLSHTQGLTEVGWRLHIESNAGLTSLQALQAVRRVGGYLKVSGCISRLQSSHATSAPRVTAVAT